MKKSTKVIIIVLFVVLFMLLLVVAGGIYIFHEFKEEGYVQNKDSTPNTTLDISEYQSKKAELEKEELLLDQEEDELERKYINHEITYEEYRNKKQEIESKEDELDMKENALEREYGVDD